MRMLNMRRELIECGKRLLDMDRTTGTGYGRRLKIVHKGVRTDLNRPWQIVQETVDDLQQQGKVTLAI